MPPRQVTPIWPSGIILVIKMPHPVEIYHAVGIIHPVGNRGVMNLRTVFFGLIALNRFFLAVSTRITRNNRGDFHIEA